MTGSRASLLFVDPGAADLYLPSLRTTYEVSSVASHDQARRALRNSQPDIVITELALPDCDGVAICRESKAVKDAPPAVLATTAAADRVPDALAAGCDGVLMKPFAPILLYSRIGLLLRQRSRALVARAAAEQLRANALVAQSRMLGTNIVRHEARCPSCGEAGVFSFDTASRGRTWCACIWCRRVWMARSAALRPTRGEKGLHHDLVVLDAVDDHLRAQPPALPEA